MSKNEMVSSVENERVLVLERVFDAKRELVFKMFNDRAFETLVEAEGLEHLLAISFPSRRRVAFLYEVCRSDTGRFLWIQSWGKAVYKEIIEPEKIVYTDYFSDEQGHVNTSMLAERSRWISSIWGNRRSW